MNNCKEIDMVMSGHTARKKYGYTGNADRCTTTFKVDLNKLTPLARVIAESIYTTDLKDDLSLIYLEGPSISASRLAEKLPDIPEQYRKAFGDEFFDTPVVDYWRFDYMRGTETPEEYFERQAQEMRDAGWYSIKRNALSKNINYEI